jgi:hypothetical protein
LHLTWWLPQEESHGGKQQAYGRASASVDTTPGRAGGSRFIRLDAQGRFTNDQVDVGRAQAADRRQTPNTALTGQKDRGD